MIKEGFDLIVYCDGFINTITFLLNKKKLLRFVQNTMSEYHSKVIYDRNFTDKEYSRKMKVFNRMAYVSIIDWNCMLVIDKPSKNE